jgi:cytosine/adenosine deaminase-related metal-dependent hydrolase
MDNVLLYNIDFLYTGDRQNQLLTDQYILIEKNIIKKIGPMADVPPKADITINQRGRIVLPGIVNVHHHFYQHITRAIPIVEKSNALGWLYNMYCLWSCIEPGDIEIATKIAVAELLLTGCTFSSDFFYLFPQKRAELFYEEIEAAKEMGIRLHVFRGCLPVLEGKLRQELEKNSLDTSELIEDKEQILSESENAILKFHDPSSYSMLQIGLGPTAIDYNDPDFMQKLKQLAKNYGVLCQTHLHPRPDEREICSNLYKKSPNRFLEQIGWMDHNTILVHVTNHNEDDIDVLAENNVSVTHSPTCHMRLGYTVAPIPLMRSKGIRIGLSVDGAASNDSGNMLNELRMALYVHRINNIHGKSDPHDWFSGRDVWHMATKEGAAVLGRDQYIGTLEEGKAADIVSFDYKRVDYAGGITDPLAALLYCNSCSRVDLSIVNGKVLVENGKLCNFDENKLTEQANEATKRIVRNAQQKTGINFGSFLG